MLANSKDFVYQTDLQKKVYKAATKKDPRRITKQKKQNTMLANVSKQGYEANVKKVVKF